MSNNYSDFDFNELSSAFPKKSRPVILFLDQEQTLETENSDKAIIVEITEFVAIAPKS